MWRSIFIGIGIMAIIIGIECMLIESANFYFPGEARPSSFFNPTDAPAVNTRQWQPQEWFPWTVLSAGVITVLYAFALPKRFQRPAAG